jgi:predicted RNase H-like HicB family nuclease
MMKAKPPPKPPERLTIVIEQGARGLWYATSPDIKGLLALGGSRERAVRDASFAMKALDRAELEARR